MGWGSAGEIFNTVADALIESDAESDVIVNILVPLIGHLKGEDWDTAEESMEAYQRREGWGAAAVIRALAQSGEQPTYCAEQSMMSHNGMTLRYTCCLYEGHPGNHRPSGYSHGEWA